MDARIPDRKDDARRRRSLMRRLRRDESGATAVELGLVALPFFAILFAIIQIGYRFFAAEALDTAVAEAARTIMTGRTQQSGSITNATQFRDQVLCNPTNRLLPSFMDCSKVVVDVRLLSSFSDAAFTTTAYDLLTGGSTHYDAGGNREKVVVRVAYGLPAIAPALTGGGAYTIDGAQVYALLGVSVFQNEPYKN